MKAGVALGLIGLMGLYAQGVASLSLPARFLPDLGLLLIVAVAIGLRSAGGGLILAALLGYATDCLSGSLLGQHMLLAVAAFGVARVAATQLNLRGPLPQATFVTFLVAAHAVALFALTAFFSGSLSSPFAAVSELLPHALVSGIAAPLVSEGVVRLLGRLGEDDGQRPLRLEARALS